VWTRRRALCALGAGGVGLLAGCTGGSDESAQTNERTTTAATSAQPETATPTATEEPTENSNYLNEDHDAYNSWWHPLRFANDHQQDTVEGHHSSLYFETRKKYAAAMFSGIGTAYADTELREQERGLFNNINVGISTEFMIDVTDKLLNWNNRLELGEAEFNQMKDLSKVYNKVVEEEDENYVMYGTVDNPRVAKVESSNIIDRIWNDQRGQYDDFGEHIET
jgi:hypothetical protein